MTPGPAVCGNNIAEGGEQCDGTDDGACRGLCQAPNAPNPCTCGGPCGNGTIDAGETCDPPTSVVGPCRQLCRDDCTYCGDTVVQAGDSEQCDDGNCGECDPAHPQKPLPGDTCNNMCTGLFCKDPSKIRLTHALDSFKSHGVIVPFEGEAVAFDGGVSVSLTANGSVIFETSLPAGAVQPMTSGAFKYWNLAAKRDGGVYRLRATPTRDGTYKVTIVAYGDLGDASADMVTHITAGDREWSVHGIWRETSSGWVFVRSTTP
jgi:hypothetical protein